MNTAQSRHTIEYFLALKRNKVLTQAEPQKHYVRMNLKNIMLSERHKRPHGFMVLHT